MKTTKLQIEGMKARLRYLEIAKELEYSTRDVLDTAFVLECYAVLGHAAAVDQLDRIEAERAASYMPPQAPPYAAGLPDDDTADDARDRAGHRLH